MNHGRIIDRWEIAINQAEFVFLQQDRPDCLDLDVGKTLTNTAMTTFKILQNP